MYIANFKFIFATYLYVFKKISLKILYLSLFCEALY